MSDFKAKMHQIQFRLGLQEGGRGKGREEEKGRDPKGWLTPPCSKSWEIP